MNEAKDELVEYYGKYNEEKRLLSPHGQIEYRTTMHYIETLMAGIPCPKVADIGAATGRYAIPLAEKGWEVTAVELVNYNLGILKQKAERAGISKEHLTAMQGDALNLSKLPADSFDLVLLLGPLYHLFTADEKVQVLQEARRIVKPQGRIIAGYIMNEFAVIRFGLQEGQLLSSVETGNLDADFHVRNTPKDLFSYERIEDIDAYRERAGLKRLKLISQDGPTNYLRPVIDSLSEEAYETYFQYHLKTCERAELIGAGCHTIDILYK